MAKCPDEIIDYILTWEGGAVNDPDDPGKATYCGMTYRDYPNDPIWAKLEKYQPLHYNQVIPELREHVVEFYEREFWNKHHLSDIADKRVAGFVMDWNVNAGGNAIKGVQRLVGVADDGVMGPHTIAAINGHDPVALLANMKQARGNFYKSLVEHHPKFSKYLTGWLNRVNNY